MLWTGASEEEENDQSEKAQGTWSRGVRREKREFFGTRVDGWEAEIECLLKGTRKGDFYLWTPTQNISELQETKTYLFLLI